ncbi:SufD family Fe-S cluster assembly protein [Pigmentibacter sp. JX0631]|uniref:SufB/SufD family protein n=1 Tax=Pigmentibacter sp. JX0631 TaxID=2976982 RepID=UPI002469A90E|nr:SufD family Fe-S cluster assembly protein [Pigmentibacter sp. JX0631]WGL59389.1 SufD family Fe-S cluster assembly protein [Pigmentibacter sp. JX0631]
MTLDYFDGKKLSLCPTYPEESWRKTNPEIFFLPENEVINFEGNNTLENLQNHFLPWKVAFRSENLLSDKINDLTEFLGSSSIEIIKNELARIIFVEVFHGRVDISASNSLKSSVEYSSKPSEIESIAPNSDIGFALASRLKASSPHEFCISINNSNNNEVPLIIVKNNTSPDFSQSYSAMKIEIEKGSRADLLLIDGRAPFNYHRHSIVIHEKSVLNQFWLQYSSNEMNKSVSLYERSVKLSANATFNDAQLFLPEGNSRVTSNVIFQGEKGQANSGGAVVSLKGKFDYEPIQHHKKPQCQSALNLKMILASRARSVFQGLVKIDKNAGKTKAFQLNKNLLLSKQARVDASPRLEILPNDVVCKHGSATGEVDQKQLYYMATRGFSPTEAKKLIIHSFARETLNNLSEASVLLPIAEATLEHVLVNTLDKV